MNILADLKKINTFVFDMDGVLTDGKVHVIPKPGTDDDYVMARSMHTKDGFALQLAVRKGYTIAIISGGIYSGADKRFTQLGIQHIFMGVKDKEACLRKLAEEQNIGFDTILFMGDDMPDIDAMRLCGVKACPMDAVPDVKSIANYISPLKGGEACVRDVVEKVLKLRGDWEIHTDITSK